MKKIILMVVFGLGLISCGNEATPTKEVYSEDILKIEKISEEVSGKIKFKETKHFHTHNENATIAIIATIDNKSNKPVYNGFLVNTKGIGTCVEKDKLYILFKDKTRISLVGWNNFNCDGDSYFDFEGKLLPKLQKPIDKIEFVNGYSFETETFDIPESCQNYFIEIYAALKEYK